MATTTTDPEVLDPPDHHDPGALALRHPGVPTTIAELAALKGEAQEIIEARIQTLNTARLGAIRATHPEDWILFKARDDQGGQVVGYLQDSGCQRVRDIFSISIFAVSEPEKIPGAEPGVFHYIVRGDGACALTNQTIERQEGGRSSTEDFCKDKTGAALELAVRKAARANLDGQIVRELAGLSSVPLIELEAAWTGTHKKIERCRRGRGFGTADERVGGSRQGVPDVDPPVCPHCNTPGVYRPAKGDRKAFYGCRNFEKHSTKKFFVDADEWVAKQQLKPSAASPAAPHAENSAAPAPSGSTQVKSAPGSLLPDEPPPITDQDIDFGGGGRGSSRKR